MAQLQTKWIANLAITDAKLASNAVITDKILDGAVTEAKLSAAVQAKLPTLDEKAALAGVQFHAPSASNPFATKSYVDAAIVGLSWKAPAGTISATAPSSPASGDTYINTTDGKYYTYDGSSWDGGVAPTNGDARLVLDADVVYEYDGDSTSWVQISGSGSVPLATTSVAGKVQIGDGIAVSSGVISVDLEPLGGLVYLGTTPNKTIGVSVDDSSIEIDDGGQVRVKDLGITNAMLAGSITDDKLAQITSVNKVAGSAVQLASDGALADNSGLYVRVDTTKGIEIDGSNNIVAKIGSGIVFDGSGNITLDDSAVEKAYAEYITLSASDITNKEIALAHEPATYSAVTVTPIGGPDQQYNVDYTIVENTGTVYVSWNGYALDGILAANDVLKIVYSYK